MFIRRFFLPLLALAFLALGFSPLNGAFSSYRAARTLTKLTGPVESVFPCSCPPIAEPDARQTLAQVLPDLSSPARKGWRYLILLPITFALLHLSYGLDFLAGLIKFWNRRGNKKGNVPSIEPAA